MDTILGRRSIRKYKPDPVSDVQIHKLLEAAMMAPSAGNKQGWHFIVCTESELVARIRQTHPHGRSLDEAPVCIVVCSDENKALKGYSPQDCGAAVENLLLAAHDMGLGTCWMGVAPMQERMEQINVIFELPEGILPFCLIAVGYPDEEPPKPERYSEEKVHYNRW